MAMVGVDDSSLPADSYPKSVHLAIWCSMHVHQMNWVNSHNGCTMITELGNRKIPLSKMCDAIQKLKNMP